MKTNHILKWFGVWLLPFLLPMAATAAHNYVNLGLPSGTLWADCNVGASSPEGYGNFYAWGETKTKSTYSWSNYQYASGSSSTTQDIGTHIAGTKYDAATSAWGSDWVMPTIDQANELIHECTLSLATVNNVKGMRFKGPNGNTIFFPMTGYKADSSHKNEGTQCYLWTETKDIVSHVAYKALAMYLERSSSSAKVNTQAAPRRSGVVIRPVRAGSQPPSPDPPTDVRVGELVDLGLSVKWCDQNVGANGESDYGNYYAWGEVTPKSTYTWANYKHASGSASTVKNIGNNIRETDYDAAYQNEEVYDPYEDEYVKTRLPTCAQYAELLNECTWKETTMDGHKGYKVTGPNGNYIFLPFSGTNYDGSKHNVGTTAYYWTSEVYSSDTQKANALYIKSGTASKMSYAQRRTGLAIRAVEIVEESVVSDDPVTMEAPYLVDLGLSVRWVSIDMGADAEGIYGDYYAWGELTPKSTYAWDNYDHANGSASTVVSIGDNIRGTDWDAAYAWENVWDLDKDELTTVCMPTKEQFEELLTKCTWKETTVSNHKGYKVTGPSGESIFLPFAGCSYDGKDYSQGVSCNYWTSEVSASDEQKANVLYIKTGTAPKMSVAQRRTGAIIRAVEYTGIGDDTSWAVTSSPELVDLGLSVRWCDVNLGFGAQKGIGEYCDYYAWGETAPKSNYTWANYQHASGSASTVKNIGSNIQATAYDAAYYYDITDENGEDVKGCLPTKAQFEELRTKCTWVEDTEYGSEGYRITGPNGNSIFLPFSGVYYDGSEHNVGTSAYYWTSEVYASDAQKANAFYVKTGTAPKMSYAQRRTGAPIRAVEYKKPASGEPYAVLSGSTLTFYCDNQKSSRSGTIYNEVNTQNNDPDWSAKRSSITKVVFNSSFANARPVSCRSWFSGMSNLTTITGISYLNTSKVTDMSGMFFNCSKLTSLDVSHFNTENVDDMDCMFYNCSKLTSLDVSHFNTAKVVWMDEMFRGCSGLTSLDVSHFNTANVVWMYEMFSNCSKLTSLDVSHFNTANVYDMSGMFYRCSSLTSLDLSSFVIPEWDEGDMPNAGEVLSYCSSLQTLAIPATAYNLEDDACQHVGTASKPCVITAPAGFNFDVSTSGSYFRWKSGYFKLASSTDTHQYVNLGLPSGTLWATCNVGASSPEGYGNFYAWGETKTKSTYSWSNYQYCNGSSSSVVNIGTHIAGTSYDAAKAAWGSNWVMPTIDQANELVHECSISLATVNNVKCIRFKGPNGNSIVFPMTGYMADSSHKNEGTQCYLWTETKDIVTNVAYKALAMYLERSTSSAKVNTQAAPKRSGVVIRAVRAGSGSANSYAFDTDDVCGVTTAAPSDDVTYTLQGVKVEGNLKPGIYIRNGKKFIVK